MPTALENAPVVPKAQALPPLSAGLVFLLAAACGLSVANLYYIQPLLAVVAQDFGIGSATAGLLVTATQIGYAAGLVFIVPLGDMLDRRTLVFVVLMVTTAGLIATALSPTLVNLVSASLVVGLTSVVAQVFVPFAASLASDAKHGRVVGTSWGPADRRVAR